MQRIEELSGPALVRAYNELAVIRGAKPVNRFPDRRTGAARVEAILEIVAESKSVRIEADGSVVLEDARPVSQEPSTQTVSSTSDERRVSPGLARLRANLGDVGAEALRARTVGDGDKALEVVAGERAAASGEPTVETARPAAASPPAESGSVKVTETLTTKSPVPPPRKSAGRAPSFSDSDVIELLRGENPKRAEAAVRYSKYKTGITVAEYTAAIGGDRKQALRDVSWDMKQGWIRVTGAKK